MLDIAYDFLLADDAGYKQAAEFLVEIKGLLAEINDTFAAPIEAAHKAHKIVLAAKKKHAEPLERAEQLLKGKIGQFIALREKAQAEARRIAQGAAIKAEEERRLEAADRLHRAGQTEAADLVLSANVQVPLAKPEPAPEVKGVSMRTTYGFRITDPLALPRSYLLPDEKKIRSVVTSLGLEARIPGVEVFEVQSVAVRA